METQKPVEWEDVKPNNENVWSYNNPEEFIDGVLIAKKSNIGPNNSNTYHLEKGLRKIKKDKIQNFSKSREQKIK